MRRIAALVDDGRVVLEEVYWDDSADTLAEIPADRFDVESLILQHVPGKIVYREILSSNGSGIYGVEDDPTALAEADWQEPTTTTEAVRSAYQEQRVSQPSGSGPGCTFEQAKEEFDAWLAEIRRQALLKAAADMEDLIPYSGDTRWKKRLLALAEEER